MRYAALLILSIVAFTSCTYEQTINFNEDFSGNAVTFLDMSMAEAASGIDTPLFRENDLNLDSINAQEGIKNASFGSEEQGMYTLKYDFDDLSALNNSFKKADSQDSEAHNYFSLKNKTLTCTLPLSRIKDEIADPNEMGETGGMFIFKLNLNFGKKIKNVSNEDFVLNYDNKGLSFEKTLAQLFEKGEDVTVKIKF